MDPRLGLDPKLPVASDTPRPFPGSCLTLPCCPTRSTKRVVARFGHSLFSRKREATMSVPAIVVPLRFFRTARPGPRAVRSGVSSGADRCTRVDRWGVRPDPTPDACHVASKGSDLCVSGVRDVDPSKGQVTKVVHPTTLYWYHNCKNGWPCAKSLTAYNTNGCVDKDNDIE